MYTPIILDTRELEAPEPMMQVMNNLDTLDDNTYIQMIHRLEPKMLYNHLLTNGFKYKVNKKGEDFYIFICKNSFANLDFFEGL